MPPRHTMRPLEGQDIFNPQFAVFPVFRRLDRANEFLGTVFFFKHDDRPLVASGQHVVAEPGDGLFGYIMPNDEVFNLQVLIEDPLSDLAVLEGSPQAEYGAFELAPVDVRIDQLARAHCLEYSTTYVQEEQFKLNPAARVGNVTRRLDLTRSWGPRGDEILELSFSTLHGASGAPVLVHDHGVVGVASANIQRELAPAMVFTALDDKNDILEETKYMLPQGLAVHVKHLHRLLMRLEGRVPPEGAPPE